MLPQTNPAINELIASRVFHKLNLQIVPMPSNISKHISFQDEILWLKAVESSCIMKCKGEAHLLVDNGVKWGIKGSKCL